MECEVEKAKIHHREHGRAGRSSSSMAGQWTTAEAEKTFEEPALIIAARQDGTVGYRDAWDILESYPRATFAVVDRATHGWPLETPHVLTTLVDDWLARVDLAERRA